MKPASKQREKIKTAMMQTFKNEMQTLNPEIQNILVDDLVTAFYSRLKVITQISKNH